MKDQPRKDKVGKLKAELSRLREREAATNEILDAISLSRADEKPVFDLILEKAAGLCKAPLAFLTLLEEDGEHFVTPAHFGNARSEFVERLRSFRGQITSTQLTARALRETKVLCIDDIADDDLYRDGDKWRVELVDVEGIRSALLVPLKRDDLVLGVCPSSGFLEQMAA